ncbi:MAG: diaminopimelate epimerase, partial [Bacteroidales bacterium]
IIRFSKYHGTGNDFILIDNRSLLFRNLNESVDLIERLCHRRFGIGGDGLILINSSNNTDFEMVYFNSDGKEGTMCGNGGRCSVAFAKSLGLIKDKTIFKAIDGNHEAIIISKEHDITNVKLKMQDVTAVQKTENYFIIDTGSPHYIRFEKNVTEMDILKTGRDIRYSKAFAEKGINVNFAEVFESHIFMRTYERGVEDETLSCGTGATATAIAACMSGQLNDKNICNIKTLGGNLTVHFNHINDSSYTDIWLEGPAICVYKGEINI